jgi:FlaA1/EpsC-like NDP-sugar epimerase
MTHPQEYFAGKVVLVTGAGGSIGSEICRRLVDYGAKELRLCGHSELPLYRVEKDVLNGSKTRIAVTSAKVILASVTDGKAMAAACDGVDIVIHAAAHKHVPLCEQNPIEAIQNNVGGTIELAQAASRCGVKQFVMVSSDKAVKPSSVMGATKRACELFVNFLSTRSSMRTTIVRFGNVLDSSGSVLPLWREQIRQGKPITLTDKRCTRYFMSIPEAVDLTLSAATLPRGGTFVLDMGAPRSLYEMAIDTIREAQVGLERARCATQLADKFLVETGLRPGEKLEEELSYGGEQVKTPFPKVFALREDARRVMRWDDFSDLMMAAKCRHKTMALDKLWEIVR